MFFNISKKQIAFLLTALCFLWVTSIRQTYFRVVIAQYIQFHFLHHHRLLFLIFTFIQWHNFRFLIRIIQHRIRFSEFLECCIRPPENRRRLLFRSTTHRLATVSWVLKLSHWYTFNFVLWSLSIFFDFTPCIVIEIIKPTSVMFH